MSALYNGGGSPLAVGVNIYIVLCKYVRRELLALFGLTKNFGNHSEIFGRHILSLSL